MASLSIRGVRKVYPNGAEVLKGIDLEIADGEFLILVGGSGCGKSTLLNMIAGLETVSGGEIAIGGRVVNDVPPKVARHRDGVPVVRAVPDHDGAREHLLRAGHPQGAEGRAEEDRRARGRDPADDPPARPQAGAAVGRPAPARRDGTRDRPRSVAVPVRRAAVQPRRQAARRDARRDQAAAPAPRQHHRLRHARPDRGDDAGRQDRRHEGRRGPAVRHAAGDLRPAGQPVRRQLHRLAVDELPARPGRRRRLRPRTRRRHDDAAAAAGTGREAPRLRRHSRHPPRTHHRRRKVRAAPATIQVSAPSR